MRVATLLLVLVAQACGRVELQSGWAPAPPPRVDAASFEGAPSEAPRDAGAPDAPTLDADVERAPTDAAAPPWPLTLRLVNVGRGDVRLPGQREMICGYELGVRRTDDTTWRQTSAFGLDSWCSCSSCSNGRLHCAFVDFLCDDQSQVLPAGQHLDLGWDGLIWAQVPVPADSGCGGLCDTFEMVKPGRYVFRLAILGRLFPDVETSLPVAGGVLEIPVAAP